MSTVLKSPSEPPKKRRPHWAWFVAGGVGIAGIAVALFLALFDWNLLREPIGRYASARTGRAVRIDGDLKVRLLTLEPRVEVGGLKVGNPRWGPKRNMAEAAKVSVTARLLPLLTGRLVLPRVAIEQPNVELLRDAQGRANWDFSTGKASKPMKLPPIQNFVIDRGQVRFDDLGRKLAFVGTVTANEQRTAAYERGFRLAGRGELNRRPFRLDLVGGPLLNVRADRPYPFDADIRAGSTRVLAKGRIPKPFDLGRIDAAVSVSGEDLNDLYSLTGLALPNTPPYRISGQFRREGPKYAYERFSGRVGASDLGGDAALDTAGDRPFLRARLHSRRLDFADLAGVFGAPGASRAAAPAQKAEVRALAAKGRLLPDATLQVERIRGMDAKVTYTAAQVVRAANLPLRTVELGVDLDHGVLKLDPVALRFPSGRLSGAARIDARGATPVSDVDLRLGDIRLEQFIPPVGGSRPLSGELLARARLTGAGASVHRAAAASNGAVTVVIPRGRMRQAFAELMGIDLTKGLFMLISKDHDPTDVRCAVADFDVRRGVLHARRVVFDTGVVLVNGSGTVDLGTETFDLAFKGKPKKFRAVRVIAPITVRGPLREPKFGVDAGGAAAQAGLGAALGAVLSPLAAILPFVSPGLEKNADCAALFAEARTGRAGVSPTAGS